VDCRPHVSPGFKFNDWEMRGVPIRLELGPRDLAAGTALLSRRLNYRQPDAGKEAIALGSAAGRLAGELAAFQAMLTRRATDFRDEHTVTVNSWPEFTAAVAVGWALALACGDQDCEDEIKAETTATPRCIPLDGEPEQGTCIRCGKPSAYGKRVIFARAYLAGPAGAASSYRRPQITRRHQLRVTSSCQLNCRGGFSFQPCMHRPESSRRQSPGQLPAQCRQCRVMRSA